MKISPNFTLNEIIASSTASKYGINNTPNAAQLECITKLVTTVLQPIRDAFGAPIIIDSGFRCPALNKKVGGVANSDHRYGAAADIHTKSDSLADNKKLWDLIIKLKDEGKISCRQIIWEHGKKNVGPSWIHVSVNNKWNSKKNNQIVYIGV